MGFVEFVCFGIEQEKVMIVDEGCIGWSLVELVDHFE